MKRGLNCSARASVSVLALALLSSSALLLDSASVTTAGARATTHRTAPMTMDISSASSKPSGGVTTGLLVTARYDHTATLLSSGKVLLAGGRNTSGSLSGAELYNPATGIWNTTGNLGTTRYLHTATLLPSGKVLVAGGFENVAGVRLSSAELYDPATESWSSTGSMGTVRTNHSVTLLPSGKVLVVGGESNSGALSSAELYDPATGSWSPTGNLGTARSGHTTTLLSSGKVLVAGGDGALGSSELYDPATGSWSSTGNLGTARLSHTATLLSSGKVLVAGGADNAGSALDSAELYDPATGTWSGTSAMGTARYLHTATLLPSGKVLVAGGSNSSTTWNILKLYDPATGSWSVSGSLDVARSNHTATLLSSGIVVMAGGVNDTGVVDNGEFYDPAMGSWSGVGSLATARSNHTATLLPSGNVLVVGGLNGFNLLGTAEIYHSDTGSWSSTDSLTTARREHTATLLPSGKVLVTGGDAGDIFSPPLSSAELYDPATGTWSNTASLSAARRWHTATLLPSGKVLVAGGDDSGKGLPPLDSAELYDPATGTWSSTGSLNVRRETHTATLLPSGKVLVAGGRFIGSSLGTAELYDPATGNWSATGNLTTGLVSHTATLLPSGKVLVAAGQSGSPPLSSAELYDPGKGTWSSTGSLGTARVGHTATMLPSGKVLVTAGGNFNGQFSSAELYDPAMETWSSTGSLGGARWAHTSVLLPSGKVLVAGGSNSGTGLSSAELYDPGLGFDPNWAPVLTTVSPAMLPNGSPLIATGSRFKGISEASGGNGAQNSSSNYPLLQLLSLTNEQMLFLSVDAATGWSDTSFTSTPITLMTISSSGFPVGHALATIFTNGIPSQSQFVRAGGTLFPTPTPSPPTPTPTATPTPTPTPSPTATPPLAPSRLGNISTRLVVESGKNVLIGGFIVTGTQPKKVIVRAMGPSVPVSGNLADPFLQLRDSSGQQIRYNDNWRSDQEQEIIATHIQPGNDLESAMVETLPANGAAYTAIVSSADNGTGVGLVEIFDLDDTVDSSLANISTRGLVLGGNNVMIAGTIVVGEAPQRVLIRGLGPSLPVAGALSDPVLELHRWDGVLLRVNNDWRAIQEQEIIATGIPPSNDLESAIVWTLSSNGSAYTTIVRGVNDGTTGVGLVEIYALTQ